MHFYYFKEIFYEMLTTHTTATTAEIDACSNYCQILHPTTQILAIQTMIATAQVDGDS